MTEIRATVPGNRGGHPIRTRAFHRALKRREPWAVSKDIESKIMRKLAAGLYTKSATGNNFFGTLDHEKMAEDRKGLPLEYGMYGLAAWLPENKE